MIRACASSGAAALAVLLLVGCSGQASTPPHAEKAGHGAPGAVVATFDAGRPTKQEIAALFDDWNDTLRTGGPNDMALLYAEDGVLLPTVSNDVRSNRVEIAAYFDHFLKMHPRGTINEQHIDVLDNNTAVNSGVYTFDLLKDNEPTFVVARYSFVYEKINGKWLIKSHHSSAMPEPVMNRPAPLADVLSGKAPPASETSHADGEPAASDDANAAADKGAADKGAAGAGHAAPAGLKGRSAAHH